MKGWTFKTSQQKSQSKQHLKYHLVFKYLFPSELVLHLETTKNMLMTKLFTTNAIGFHTLPDYYLDAETANAGVGLWVGKMLGRIGEEGEGEGEIGEKLKNALFFADENGMRNVPWFLM